MHLHQLQHEQPLRVEQDHLQALLQPGYPLRPLLQVYRHLRASQLIQEVLHAMIGQCSVGEARVPESAGGTIKASTHNVATPASMCLTQV